MKAFKRPIVPRLLASLVCALVGVGGAELFLRMLVPEEVFHSMWYEPGIHQPDEELGFALTPSYCGAMRHRDHTWFVPLELDQHGCRLPMSTSPGVPGENIVLLGGRSMVFGYGLKSSETLAARIASHSISQTTVHTLAWDGFDLNRDWKKYERFIEPNIRPNVVIVCLYTRDEYSDLRSAVRMSPLPWDADLFRFHDSLILHPRGWLAESIGRPVYLSYVLGGICREVNHVDQEMRRYLARFFSNSDRDTDHHATTPEIGPVPIANQHPDFLLYLRDRVAAQGARVVVVALPHRTDWIGPPDLGSIVPEGIEAVDLRGCLKDANADWKAQGHYGADSAEIVGSLIANSLHP